MKFSFILCTRNSERVLTEVVESIANQKIDHRLIEVILADYDSTDQTIEIVKNISNKIFKNFPKPKILKGNI